MIVVYAAVAVAVAVYSVYAWRARKLARQAPVEQRELPDNLLAAVLDLTAEVRGLKAVVQGERRARRWLGVVLLLVILIGVRNELVKRDQDQRDRVQSCHSANDARSAIRDSFNDLANELAPPGSPGRAKADEFLISLAKRLPDKDCG